MFTLMPYYAGLIITLLASDWLKFPVLIHIYLGVCCVDILALIIQSILRGVTDYERQDIPTTMEPL